MASFTTLKDFAAVPRLPDRLIAEMKSDFGHRPIPSFDGQGISGVFWFLAIGRAMYDGKTAGWINSPEQVWQQLTKAAKIIDYENVQFVLDLLQSLDSISIDEDRIAMLLDGATSYWGVSVSPDTPDSDLRLLLKDFLYGPVRLQDESYGGVCTALDALHMNWVHERNKIADVNDPEDTSYPSGPSIELSRNVGRTYDTGIIAGVFAELVDKISPPAGSVAFVGAGSNPVYEDAIVAKLEGVDKSSVVYIDPLGHYSPPSANETIEVFASRPQNKGIFAIVGIIRPYVNGDSLQKSFASSVASMLCRGGCIIMYADENPCVAHVPMFSTDESLLWHPIYGTEFWNVWIKH
jgi:hypothetical protein